MFVYFQNKNKGNNMNDKVIRQLSVIIAFMFGVVLSYFIMNYHYNKTMIILDKTKWEHTTFEMLDYGEEIYVKIK